jgi:hypothetical protein
VTYSLLINTFGKDIDRSHISIMKSYVSSSKPREIFGIHVNTSTGRDKLNYFIYLNFRHGSCQWMIYNMNYDEND